MTDTPDTIERTELLRELAIQRGVSGRTDEIINLVGWVTEGTNLVANTGFTKTQASQLLNWALQAPSVAAIKAWIKNQSRRGTTQETWSTGGLASWLVYWLTGESGEDDEADEENWLQFRPTNQRHLTHLRQMAEDIVAHESDVLVDEDIPEVWLQLTRLFVGYLRWHVTVIDSERDQ